MVSISLEASFEVESPSAVALCCSWSIIVVGSERVRREATTAPSDEGARVPGKLGGAVSPRDLRRRLIPICEHFTRNVPTVQPNALAISKALSPWLRRTGIRSNAAAGILLALGTAQSLKAPIGGRSEHPALHRHMTWSRRSTSRFNIRRVRGVRRVPPGSSEFAAGGPATCWGAAGRLRDLSLAFSMSVDAHYRGLLVTPDLLTPQDLAQSNTNGRNCSVESQPVIRPRARVA
jgi:hypothetical protein